MKNIEDIFGDENPNFKLEITVKNDSPNILGEHSYKTISLGNGFCDMYLDGKFIKTIHYPKDNVFRPEDFIK